MKQWSERFNIFLTLAIVTFDRRKKYSSKHFTWFSVLTIIIKFIFSTIQIPLYITFSFLTFRWWALIQNRIYSSHIITTLGPIKTASRNAYHLSSCEHNAPVCFYIHISKSQNLNIFWSKIVFDAHYRWRSYICNLYGSLWLHHVSESAFFLPVYFITVSYT